MEAVFAGCREWDPTTPARPLRAADWFRQHLNELRRKFTVTRERYHRSGNQEAENEYDEFANFVDGDYRVLYAFTVWGDETQAFMDRRLEFQAEEGVEVDESAQTSSPPRSKRSRLKARAPNSDHKRHRAMHVLEVKALEDQQQFHEAVVKFMDRTAANAERQQKISNLQTIINEGWASVEAVAQAKDLLAKLLMEDF